MALYCVACPSGTAESLEGSRYDPLVCIGDDAALARAMARLLDAPLDIEFLRWVPRTFTVARG
jgi:hypothetical protein